MIGPLPMLMLAAALGIVGGLILCSAGNDDF